MDRRDSLAALRRRLKSKAAAASSGRTSSSVAVSDKLAGSNAAEEETKLQQREVEKKRKADLLSTEKIAEEDKGTVGHNKSGMTAAEEEERKQQRKEKKKQKKEMKKKEKEREKGETALLGKENTEEETKLQQREVEKKRKADLLFTEKIAEEDKEDEGTVGHNKSGMTAAEEEERKQQRKEKKKQKKEMKKKEKGETALLGKENTEEDGDQDSSKNIELSSKDAPNNKKQVPPKPPRGRRKYRPIDQYNAEQQARRPPAESSSSNKKGEPKGPPQTYAAGAQGQVKNVPKEKQGAGKRVLEGEQGEGEKEISNEEYAALFLQFLNGYIKPDDGDGFYYPSLVGGMQSRGSKVLTVDFYHLLWKKNFKVLAVKVGSGHDYLWLGDTIPTFLAQHGYECEDPVVQFTNKPSSVLSWKKFMESKKRWQIKKTLPDLVYAATSHGRTALHVLVKEVIDKQGAQISYNGEFTEDDLLWLGPDRVWLYASPRKKTQSSCKKDLVQIWNLMKQYYAITNDAGDVVYGYPLQFSAFVVHLTEMDEVLVTSEWYRKLIPYHPALASYGARWVFTTVLYRLITRKWAAYTEEFLMALPCTRKRGERSVWTSIRKVDDIDWRDDLLDVKNPVLKGVFWCNFEKSKESKKTKGDKSKDNEPNLPFRDTVWGLLWFRRNILEHAHEHTDVNDLEQLELFAVMKCDPYLLPFLLMKILQLAKAKQEKYGEALKAYYGSFK